MQTFTSKLMAKSGAGFGATWRLLQDPYPIETSAGLKNWFLLLYFFI
jgi:hypothetical protein